MPVCIVHTESNSTMLRALCSLVKSSGMRRKLLTSLTASGDNGDNAEAWRGQWLQTRAGDTGLLSGSVCVCAARPPPPPRSRLIVMVLLLRLLLSGTHLK